MPKRYQRRHSGIQNTPLEKKEVIVKIKDENGKEIEIKKYEYVKLEHRESYTDYVSLLCKIFKIDYSITPFFNKIYEMFSETENEKRKIKIQNIIDANNSAKQKLLEESLKSQFANIKAQIMNMKDFSFVHKNHLIEKLSLFNGTVWFDKMVNVLFTKIAPKNIRLAMEIYSGWERNKDEDIRDLYRKNIDLIKEILRNDMVKYQLLEFDGISPNSFVDLAKKDINLTKIQKDFIGSLKRISEDFTDKAILLSTPTSTGKTVIISAFITYFAKDNTFVYVAPNEILCLQTFAILATKNVVRTVIEEKYDVTPPNYNVVVCLASRLNKYLDEEMKNDDKTGKIIVCGDEIDEYDLSKIIENKITFIGMSATMNSNVKESFRDYDVCVHENSERIVPLYVYKNLQEILPYNLFGDKYIGISPSLGYKLFDWKQHKNGPVAIISYDDIKTKEAEYFSKHDKNIILEYNESKKSQSEELFDITYNNKNAKTLVFCENPEEEAYKFAEYVYANYTRDFPRFEALENELMHIYNVLMNDGLFRLKKRMDNMTDQRRAAFEKNNKDKVIKAVISKYIINLDKLLYPSSLSPLEKKWNAIISDFRDKNAENLGTFLPEYFRFGNLNVSRYTKDMQLCRNIKTSEILLSLGVYYVNEKNSLKQKLNTVNLLINNYLNVLFVDKSFSRGINLPVRNVVVLNNEKFSQQELNQMAGRGARKLYDSKGCFYII